MIVNNEIPRFYYLSVKFRLDTYLTENNINFILSFLDLRDLIILAQVTKNFRKNICKNYLEQTAQLLRVQCEEKKQQIKDYNKIIVKYQKFEQHFESLRNISKKYSLQDFQDELEIKNHQIGAQKKQLQKENAFLILYYISKKDFIIKNPIEFNKLLPNLSNTQIQKNKKQSLTSLYDDTFRLINLIIQKHYLPPYVTQGILQFLTKAADKIIKSFEYQINNYEQRRLFGINNSLFLKGFLAFQPDKITIITVNLISLMYFLTYEKMSFKQYDEVNQIFQYQRREQNFNKLRVNFSKTLFFMPQESHIVEQQVKKNMLTNIFKFLTLKELLEMRLICKSWNVGVYQVLSNEASLYTFKKKYIYQQINEIGNQEELDKVKAIYQAAQKYKTNALHNLQWQPNELDEITIKMFQASNLLMTREFEFEQFKDSNLIKTQLRAKGQTLIKFYHNNLVQFKIAFYYSDEIMGWLKENIIQTFEKQEEQLKIPKMFQSLHAYIKLIFILQEQKITQQDIQKLLQLINEKDQLKKSVLNKLKLYQIIVKKVRKENLLKDQKTDNIQLKKKIKKKKHFYEEE